jgi:quinol monooxygenase YgiN
MIVVLGALEAKPETFDALLALCLEHVRRSRAEPGCLSHDVHRHAETPLKLVFVERWADKAALAQHFALKDSRAFVREAMTLSAAPPHIEVLEAEALAMP